MRYFFLIAVFLNLVACLPQTLQLASESIRQERSLCNSFDKNGFEGILSVNNLTEIHEDIDGYSTRSSVLKLINIPTYFNTDRSSYIQFHLIRYENNRPILNEDSSYLVYFNDRVSVVPIRKKTIDHISISETDARDTRDFLYNYKFIINDTTGWDVLNIGVYNSLDNPITDHQVQILVPPFSTDPHVYKEQKTASPSLVNLHPFSEFLNMIDLSENFFLEKSKTACDGYL